MAARTVGVSPVALTGFDGLDRSRKKRIEAILRRLLGLVNGKGWSLGLFDAEGELLDYDVMRSGIGGREALSLLCKMPFPASQGPVVLQASVSPAENAAWAIGVATPAGTGRSLAWIAQLPSIPDPAPGELADELARLTHQIALEMDGTPGRDGERWQPDVRNGFHGFYLLDPRLEVKRAWHTREPLSCDFADLVEPRDNRLPTIVERAVRRLTVSWNFSSIGACATGVAHP